MILALAAGFRKAGTLEAGARLSSPLLESEGDGDAGRRRRLLVGDLAELVVDAATGE